MAANNTKVKMGKTGEARDGKPATPKTAANKPKGKAKEELDVDTFGSDVPAVREIDRPTDNIVGRDDQVWSLRLLKDNKLARLPVMAAYMNFANTTQLYNYQNNEPLRSWLRAWFSLVRSKTTDSSIKDKVFRQVLGRRTPTVMQIEQFLRSQPRFKLISESAIVAADFPAAAVVAFNWYASVMWMIEDNADVYTDSDRADDGTVAYHPEDVNRAVEYLIFWRKYYGKSPDQGPKAIRKRESVDFANLKYQRSANDSEVLASKPDLPVVSFDLGDNDAEPVNRLSAYWQVFTGNLRRSASNPKAASGQDEDFDMANTASANTAAPVDPNRQGGGEFDDAYDSEEGADYTVPSKNSKSHSYAFTLPRRITDAQTRLGLLNALTNMQRPHTVNAPDYLFKPQLCPTKPHVPFASLTTEAKAGLDIEAQLDPLTAVSAEEARASVNSTLAGRAQEQSMAQVRDRATLSLPRFRPRSHCDPAWPGWQLLASNQQPPSSVCS